MTVTGNVYSSLKALAYPDRLRAAAQGIVLSPIHVNVDLTNYCTQRCSFCMYQVATELGGQKRAIGLGDRLSDAILARLPEEFRRAGVRGVEITGGGEPTAHVGFGRFALALAGAGIKFGVITNGDLLERHLETLRQATFVRLSISSLSERRHRAIRRPKTDRAIYTTLRALAALCRLPGPIDREIGIGFTISAENADEVLAVCQTAKALGCQNVRLTMTWVDDPAAAYPATLEAEVARQVAEARATLEGAGFRIYGPDEWRAYQLERLPGHEKGYRRCGYAYFVVNVTADGRCWPCCVMRGVPGWSFGNLHDQPFDEIVTSAARRDLVNGIAPRGCLPCIWSPRNEAIEPYLDGRVPVPRVGLTVKHAEFI